MKIVNDWARTKKEVDDECDMKIVVVEELKYRLKSGNHTALSSSVSYNNKVVS